MWNIVRVEIRIWICFQLLTSVVFLVDEVGFFAVDRVVVLLFVTDCVSDPLIY